MKKRSCRMTAEEKAIHEFAVKIRKMTDRQLYEYVKEKTRNISDVSDFIKKLDNCNISGIGKVTVKKIKEFAIREGFKVGN